MDERTAKGLAEARAAGGVELEMRVPAGFERKSELRIVPPSNYGHQGTYIGGGNEWTSWDDPHAQG